MKVSTSTALLLSVASFAASVSNVAVAFAPTAINHHHAPTTTTPPRTTSSLSMAGFGGGSSSTKKGKNPKKSGSALLPKLKAKTQWDRYQNDLKASKSATVGVRIKSADDTSNNEWMEVGRVRSATDEYEMAIARQRALIAEHSKRLYVLQIPEESVLEWGMKSGGDEEEGGDDEVWTVVDKSCGDDAPKGIEKKIGFEGISDEATGYYCYYHEGRVITKQEKPKGGAGAAFKNVKGK